MLMIRNVNMNDLPTLIRIEHLCFSKEEAASEEAFVNRIQKITDSFFVAEKNDKVIGFVNGPVIENKYITDNLFRDVNTNKATGGHQSILGLAVSPNYQKQGVASALLTHIEKISKTKQRQTITLTCKEELVTFYERNGYQNEGISNSVHGGEVWFNMVKIL
ncbi:GNAT family N-acetyltransferase [Fredinandcohnia sp. 179-A 10B2 NHS]|uniref:GNAT family N-acetyltransferase n=1 Tax=Fredinandcohnia sp. 179-A 10B2 NHS TaxID=3235176 RepID=UPI00399FDA5A